MKRITSPTVMDSADRASRYPPSAPRRDSTNPPCFRPAVTSIASMSVRTLGPVIEPGDTVVVHGGVYREWVRPRYSGLSDRRRITYTSAAGDHVVIKGSEQVTGWQHVDGNVWSVVIPNHFFGSFNPFAEEINGDWIVYADQSTPKKHLGDVYLNGISFYEVASSTEVGL